VKELTDLSKLLEPVTIPLDSNVNETKWNYIASFIVDLRHEPDYGIIDHNYITLDAGMDNECYFSECMGNAELGHFLNTKITGKLDIDMEPGVYRLVYGVNAKGEQYDTQDGVEYDSWEEYELLSTYKYNEKEEPFATINEEEAMFKLETEDGK